MTHNISTNNQLVSTFQKITNNVKSNPSGLVLIWIVMNLFTFGWCYFALSNSYDATVQQNILLLTGVLTLGTAIATAYPLFALQNSIDPEDRVTVFKSSVMYMSLQATIFTTLILGLPESVLRIPLIPSSIYSKLIAISLVYTFLLCAVAYKTAERERTLADECQFIAPRIVEILGHEPTPENTETRIIIPQAPAATYQPNETEQSGFNV